LEAWATRAGVGIVKGTPGGDPSAVVFDALRSQAGARADVVIVDTAGRLHTQHNLMAELAKVNGVIGREVPGAPHETLLVLDATTGQNGLAQARQFMAATHVTGLVLAKLDGSAKGGIAFPICRELGISIAYIGTGEGMDDLAAFDAAAYVDGLLASDGNSAR
jgi:fused signal recognition particle receptor